MRKLLLLLLALAALPNLSFAQSAAGVTGVLTPPSSGGGGGGSPGGASWSVQFNNGGNFGGILPGETGLHFLNWSSLSAAPTLSLFNSAAVIGTFTGCTVPSSDILYADGTCKTGSGMVYPGAGIPNSTGTAWGTSYSATNLIPANFIPTLNQDTTGTAANITAADNATLVTLDSLTSANGSTIPLMAGTLAGSTGSFVVGHCIEVGSSAPLEVADAGSGCGTGGSGISQLTGDVLAGPGSGSQAASVVKVNGGAVPASANCVSTNSSSQFVAGCPQSLNPQTGPTYTVASTDAGRLLTFNNASAIAVTLPVATTTGFGTGFAFTVQNTGVGLVTITPTTSTINGAASLAIPQNMGCGIVSDGTNYQVGTCAALLNQVNAAASGTSFTPACAPGAATTVNAYTATGNLTINAPTGCVDGQAVRVRIKFTASVTYAWNAAYHAGSTTGITSLPTASSSASGEDYLQFADDTANTRFNYMAIASF